MESIIVVAVLGLSLMTGISLGAVIGVFVSRKA